MSKTNYKCRFCGFECSSTKERVKCLDCNKMGLVPVEEKVKEEKINRNEEFKRNKRNPNQARFPGLLWEDDGSLCREDKKITKILNKIGKPSSRNRGSRTTMKECEKCHKEFKAFTQLEYCCPKCIQDYI